MPAPLPVGEVTCLVARQGCAPHRPNGHVTAAERMSRWQWELRTFVGVGVQVEDPEDEGGGLPYVQFAAFDCGQRVRLSAQTG